MNTLETDIIVALRTLPTSTRNQFSGRGVSRKREPVATKVVAENIARTITRNHRFSRDNEQGTADHVLAALHEALVTLPDDLVRAFASKKQLERHPAGEEICRILLERLQSQWEVMYVQPEIRGFSTPPYIGD